MKTRNKNGREEESKRSRMRRLHHQNCRIHYSQFKQILPTPIKMRRHRLSSTHVCMRVILMSKTKCHSLTAIASGSIARGLLHFFLAAALVTLAPVGSFFSTALITPTATVCLMSRTAKRPRGGYSAKVSTVMGLVGIIFTNPASPFFRNLGSFSNSLPERRSTLVMISANFTAMCEVWQSSTGAYPLPIWPGWFMMITCDVKLAASLAGSFLESEATKPRFSSFTATFLTLNPTLSPGSASVSASWCISTDFTSVVRPVGAKHTSIPGLMTPVSTRPTGTVPMPPILYTSCSGSLSGLSDGRLGSETLSSASSSVGPLYQSKFVDLSIMLSPSKPEMGTKGILSGLYPTFFR
ncbi:hypothetical protein Mapa_000434 [Marchantia paleacea]|nr:hypothetical protein Mapa_000434 [Marchantia paleacea]